MKKVVVILLAGLLAVALGVPALAWELNLRGDFICKYDYITQAGKAGFFGAYDTGSAGLFVAGGPNWAAMNGWVGARTLQGSAGTQFGLVTGADASFNYQRVELHPEIRVNPAIRIRGLYQIGGTLPIANPYLLPAGTTTPPFEYSVYQNSARFGAHNPIDTGSWTQWWATAQTPYGVVAFGKRGFGFGIGVQYVATNMSSEALTIVAPYGPLRFGFGGYLHRRQTFVNAYVNGSPFPQNIVGGGGLQLQVAGSNVSFFDNGTFLKQWDHDSGRNLQPYAFLTYRTGPLEVGLLYEYLRQHDGPHARATWGPLTASPGGLLIANSWTTVTRDQTLEDGCVYMKYNNGRFFLNSELAWVRGNVHYSLPLTPIVPIGGLLAGGGSPYAPTALETWKFGTEFGVLAGPSKFTLFFSSVPGPDRRAGIWINNQTWENVINGTFFGNAEFFKPYSMLMAYQYGSGLNAVDANGEGYMTDAVSYAARIDYSVAANLNIYSSFFYANRRSHGWGWGALTPAQGGDVVLLGRSTANGNYVPAFNNFYQPDGAVGLASPNIPDNSLGWEIDAGMDWKLLEGFHMSLRGAYWNVGNWFKFACVDRSVAGSVTGAAALQAVNGITLLRPNFADGVAIGSQWGVNPSKSIDPIWGIQGSLAVDF